MKKNIYVDIHILQTVPPSCLNRDDIGSPKTAVYGGVTRARVSSQSIKHAMRKDFTDRFPAEALGSRTKYVRQLVAEKIQAMDANVDAEQLAETVLNAGKITVKKDGKTDVLFFISDAQAQALAEVALQEDPKEKKKYEKAIESALENAASVDIALFGRMVASAPKLNVDAAAQVAHAISTHAVKNEYDYFTAVDDLSPEDTAGAGHLGTIEYNSSTMYRYATLNVLELAESLQDKTIDGVRGFVESFIYAMPDGKQNTFANRTLPDMVYMTLREDQPVNLVAAFEKPVTTAKGGYVAASEEALIDYAQKIYDRIAPAPVCAFGVDLDDQIGTLATTGPLTDLISQLVAAVADRLEVIHG